MKSALGNEIWYMIFSNRLAEISEVEMIDLGSIRNMYSGVRIGATRAILAII